MACCDSVAADPYACAQCPPRQALTPRRARPIVPRPFSGPSPSTRLVRKTISIADFVVGGDTFAVMAGPCAVETKEQLFASADAVAAAGAALLRGGAFKPRTSPKSFQGLGTAGLELLSLASQRTGLPVVTEVLDPRDVAAVAEHAAVLQIGARNMQNFPLLREVGRQRLPVLLKGLRRGEYRSPYYDKVGNI